VAACGGLLGPEWCGPKPPSTTSAIMCLYEIRSPHHLHVTSTPLHFICIHIIHLHASCLPIGRSPPCLPVHNQFITGKARRRTSYSQNRVHLASESSDTNRELSLNPRLMQNRSRTLQQTTSSLSKRSAHAANCLQWPPTACRHGITQHIDLFCHSKAYFMSSQFLQRIRQFCLRDSSS
jgi:hypothetical protein